MPQQMMAERETETDAREEAWVIATTPAVPIRARNVNWFLERGGSIKEVRLTESETGEWSVWLRLAGRSGEHRLAMFKSDEPRVYRDVARAIGYCAGIKSCQTPSERWCKCYEDRIFRWLVGTPGTPIEVAGVYQIRHVEKGRYAKGSAWSRLRSKIRRMQE